MKNGQLSYQDRVKLQSYLEDEIPVKVICKKLDVAKQSIYREIKRNGILKARKTNVSRINCVYLGNCPYLPKGCNPVIYGIYYNRIKRLTTYRKKFIFLWRALYF